MSHPKVSLEVKDHGWIQLFKAYKTIKDSYIKVGLLGDGESEEGGELTVPQIGVVQEFGSPENHIPARPFLRSTFEEQREKLTHIGKELISEVLEGKQTIEKALDVIGLTLSTAVKKKITDGDGVPPPNAPSTVARKRHGKKGTIRPLVDTGRMLNAITWATFVNGKEEE